MAFVWERSAKAGHEEGTEMQTDKRKHLYYPLLVTSFGVLLTFVIAQWFSSDRKPPTPHDETKQQRPTESRTAVETTPKPDALHCPTCGDKLVLRHNRTTGEAFFGCSRYPLCKGTRPYDEKLAKAIPPDKKRSLQKVGPRSTGEELEPPEER